MRPHFAILLPCLLVCASVLAAPAPWYLWRSRIDGQVFCAQTSPGVGWQRVGGPYREAHCEKAGMPGH
jgi:hypothetical protein